MVVGGVLNDVSNVLFYIIIIIIAIQRISRNLTAFLPGRILAEEYCHLFPKVCICLLLDYCTLNKQNI